ncbi:hydantoinase B/oxoprolinase family protein, partial [bacterium]|nr:hydantoinase B/oxoprolinase family protein [bacterium]
MAIFSYPVSITTIASGGGSLLTIDHGLLKVGPESGGSFPGPSCYLNGGDLCITDANVVLGRIDLASFPKVFGNSGKESISPDQSRAKFQEMIDQKFKNNPPSIEKLALSFVEVADQMMAEAIKSQALIQGFSPKDHHLVCYGGASSQHACSVARILELEYTFIPRDCSILSALGIFAASRVNHSYEAIQKALDESVFVEMKSKIKEDHEYHLLISYDQCHCKISMSFLRDSKLDDLLDQFHASHLSIFGFQTINAKIYLHELCEIKKESGEEIPKRKVQNNNRNIIPNTSDTLDLADKNSDLIIYMWDELDVNEVILGPCLICSSQTSIFVDKDFEASLLQDQCIQLKNLSRSLDETESLSDLAIYSKIFQSIATQMGYVLQMSSVSINIKERHDFSCAIFDEQGNLIANAPHVPVHLGSMSNAVKKVIEAYPSKIPKNTAILTNSPVFGGTHLPDFTVISPVYIDDDLIAYVASRGHHSEIGGISPGSMPADSTKLSEEGAIFDCFEIGDWILKNTAVFKGNHDRRQGQAGAGFTGVAMAAMLQQDGFFKKYANAESAPADDLNLLAPKPPHFVPKAKRCIFLFMYGGPSQMDLFDHKPYLQ